MNDSKILRIFMMPQEFPCGEQSSCCGPIGQSEQEIQNLKGGIEKELPCKVEVLNVKNDDDMKNHPRIVQLLHSLGPKALPILTLDDEVVSMANPTPEKAIAAIREKTGKENKMLENANSDEARQESPDDSQACCPSASGSGDCCSPDAGGSAKSWKIVVFLVIVVAAGAVLARSFIKRSNSTAEQTQQLFPTIQPDGESDAPSLLTATANVETPAESIDNMDSPSAVDAATKAQVSDETAPGLWGKPLDSLASLNKVAANSNAVFIFLAAEDQQSSQPITKEIEAAAKKIQSNGIRVSAFTLKKGAPNYAQLAKQFSLPCVLAMVKGAGASGVSGEITEAKLIQAFVAASRPASACCPSGAPCGPTK